MEQSSNYAKHIARNPLQRALIARFHNRLVERITDKNPQSFLDAGCGEGFFTRELTARLPCVAVTGCDLSPAAVRHASLQCPRASFVVADVLALPFADNAFDVVGCFEVLEHLPAELPERAIRELSRVAVYGVVLSVPHEPHFSLANLARGKNLAVRPPGSDPDHRHWWSRREFAHLVDRSLDIEWLGGSFPWSICVAKARSAVCLSPRPTHRR